MAYSSRMLESHSALNASRRLGLVFGVGLAVIEVFYNFPNPAWWPFVLVDYIAVALLVYGSLRNERVLMAGWGFACAMFYMAFFASWANGSSGFTFTGMGLLFAMTVAGLLLSLRAAKGTRRT